MKATGLLSVALAAALLLAACGGRTAPPGGDRPTADPPTPWSTVTVTGSVVNLRAGPGTSHPILGQVQRGDSLQVTGGTDEWYRVYLPRLSLFAWIYAPLTSGAELP